MPNSDYFEFFCEQRGIHFERRDAAELSKIANVCFNEISQDRRPAPNETLENSLQYYSALIHTYTEKFLPLIGNADLAYDYLLSCYPEGVSHKDHTEQNVAHLMAIYGHKKLLEMIIDRDPTIVMNENNDGLAPIHAAIQNHQPEIVKLILDRISSAAVLLGPHRRLPLHMAIFAGDEQMVRYCCEANHESAVINAPDKEGNTPWMLAVTVDDAAILDLLDSYSIDKNISSRCNASSRTQV